MKFSKGRLYLVAGEKNDTSTMMDTAVYDIQSKKMLFRAPGTSSVRSRSTPVNLSEELRDDSVKSFNEATDAMIINLDMQLARFREKIKSNPQQVKIVKRASYSGGGVFGLFDLAIMLLLILAVLIRNQFKAVDATRLNTAKLYY